MLQEGPLTVDSQFLTKNPMSSKNLKMRSSIQGMSVSTVRQPHSDDTDQVRRSKSRRCRRSNDGHRDQQVTEDDGGFQVLYSKEMQGSSNRSFSDFSCDLTIASTLDDSLGDFGYDEITKIERKKKSKDKSSRNVNSAKKASHHKKLSKKIEDKLPLGNNSRNTISLKQVQEEESQSMSLHHIAVAQLIEELRKDCERAEKDLRFAVLLQHELNNVDALLSVQTKKASNVDCKEKIAHIEYLLEKVTSTRRLQPPTTQKPENARWEIGRASCRERV